MPATADGWEHLGELYAAGCVYLCDPGRAERLLGHVLSDSDPAAPSPDRRMLHRTVYLAAVDAGARSATPRPESSPLEHALALLPLGARASVFLVDACGLRYVDVARILGVTAESIGTTVATGRTRLRTTLELRGSHAPERSIARPAARN